MAARRFVEILHDPGGADAANYRQARRFVWMVLNLVITAFASTIWSAR